jgi:hypothetical protein
VKTYHLPLDAEGAIVVSAGVFKGLKRANVPGIIFEAPVTKPPDQRLSLGRNGEVVDATNVRGLPPLLTSQEGSSS